MSRLILRLLLVLTLLLASMASADVEVYRAQYRTADELLPLVEAALSEGGSVALDARTNSLVLVGTSTEISQALALLAVQDKRLRTVLIEHETQSATDLAAAGVSIAWSTSSGAVRVGNVPRRTSGVSVRLGEGARRESGSQTATVRVLEGSWARIASGTEALVPIGTRRRPGAVLVGAESGLEVRPRILGDGRVRLDLRPFQGSLGRGGVVSRSGADTTLVVTPGDTTVVGGLDSSSSSQSSSLLSGSRKDQRQSQQLLLVTVTIDGDSGD